MTHQRRGPSAPRSALRRHTGERRRAVPGLVAPSEMVNRFETARCRQDGAISGVGRSFAPDRGGENGHGGLPAGTPSIAVRTYVERAPRNGLDHDESANRAKSQFLTMMNHELRTPLQSILGYAEFLLSGPEGSLTEEQREDIGYIFRGGHRMLALIGQLLDLSRIEAGLLTVLAEPLDLGAALTYVRQTIAPQANAKGLAFHLDVPPSLPEVLGDAARVQQILLTLAGNAVKFTEEGSVHIAALTTLEGVAVAVWDTGIGIAEEALPGIFEAFSQVDNSMTRRHDGAGLGLAIARKLAEMMGGQITVSSIPGAGSIFTLHLISAPAYRG